MVGATGHGVGLYEDFPEQRLPSEKDLDEALRAATVVIDANVLLNLYRYTESTCSDLLGVMQTLGDRLWVPHQVAREFWRNRLSVIGSRGVRTEQTLAALGKQLAASVDNLNQWAKSLAVPAEDRDPLIVQLSSAYDAVAETVRGRAPALAAVGPGGEDPVLAQLEVLLDGRVGRPLDPTEWQSAVAEGNARVARKEPPGYLDAEKADSGLPEGAAGDYLVWHQTLQEASRRENDVIIVTGDEKEDWWWKHRGQFLGPNMRLATEFSATCGRRLFMMRPGDLLLRAGAVDVTVNSSSVDDVERVSREASQRPTWSPAGVFALLEHLVDEGWDHAEVIRVAARNGGVVDRQTVYEICGYDDERMLRGFTRPPARITASLQRQGIVADEVEAALTPVYEGGVKAVAFTIPKEMISILAEDGEGGELPPPTASSVDHVSVDRPGA